jgi:hypothetical protein
MPCRLKTEQGRANFRPTRFRPPAKEQGYIPRSSGSTRMMVEGRFEPPALSERRDLGSRRWNSKGWRPTVCARTMSDLRPPGDQRKIACGASRFLSVGSISGRQRIHWRPAVRPIDPASTRFRSQQEDVNHLEDAAASIVSHMCGEAARLEELRPEKWRSLHENDFRVLSRQRAR